MFERRFTPRDLSSIQIRKQDDQPRRLAGYAAVFYRNDDPSTEYRIVDDLVERIMPGAFDGVIADQDDVMGRYNHELLLGRRSAGHVALSVDDVGLRYEIELLDGPHEQRLVQLIERGDLRGSSFAFRVYGGRRGKVTFAQEVVDGRTLDVRLIHAVDMHDGDVGPVDNPAYKGTTTGLRAEGDVSEILAQRQQWRSSLLLPSDEDLARHLDMQIKTCEFDCL